MRWSWSVPISERAVLMKASPVSRLLWEAERISVRFRMAVGRKDGMPGGRWEPAFSHEFGRQDP